MIDKATLRDTDTVTDLASELWGAHDRNELRGEFAKLLNGGDGAVFLASEDGAPAGFAQVQLRHDYVEGTGSSPVGYLEGIFVREAYRHRGHASQLLSACEGWAREQGCSEFASDCELNNAHSRSFHLAAGFTEANRIICFTKKL